MAAPASSGQPCRRVAAATVYLICHRAVDSEQPPHRITTAPPARLLVISGRIGRRSVGGGWAVPADPRYRARELHPPPSDPGRVLLWYSNTVATVDRSSEEPAGPPANALSTRAPTPGSRTARQVPRQPLGWWLPAPPRRRPPRRPTGSSRTIPARSCTIIIIPSN